MLVICIQPYTAGKIGAIHTQIITKPGRGPSCSLRIDDRTRRDSRQQMSLGELIGFRCQSGREERGEGGGEDREGGERERGVTIEDKGCIQYAGRDRSF